MEKTTKGEEVVVEDVHVDSEDATEKATEEDTSAGKGVDEKETETESEKAPVKPLDEEQSQLAVNTLLNQALSYMIDNGMVEIPDELRTLNVINREKVVRKVDEEGIGDDVFKEIGKIAGEMSADGGTGGTGDSTKMKK